MIREVCSGSKATAQPMITSATPQLKEGPMEMPMNINTNIMKNMCSRAGREGKQRLAGCQGTNYVVKPTFRYLNGDMRVVD